MTLIDRKSQEYSSRALSLFAAKAQRALGLTGEVSLRITSSRELQELNRRFRRKNKPTDVLSFPSAAPALAGDIAISVEIAAANAREIGHPLTTELKILILHGLLHLAGYDHEADHGEMSVRELELRQQLNLPVGLIERTHAQSHPAGTKRASVRRTGALPYSPAVGERVGAKRKRSGTNSKKVGATQRRGSQP